MAWVSMNYSANRLTIQNIVYNNSKIAKIARMRRVMETTNFPIAAQPCKLLSKRWKHVSVQTSLSMYIIFHATFIARIPFKNRHYTITISIFHHIFKTSWIKYNEMYRHQILGWMASLRYRVRC